MSSSTTTFTLLAVPWVLFFAYWTASMIYEAVTKKIKKVEKREPLAMLLLSRLFLYISIILIFANEALQKYYPFGLKFLPESTFIMYFGFAVTFVGILFSIWGRIVLGNNWSADAELKSGQNLVQKGPYKIVRHLIYTGITLGIIGSAIAESDLAALFAVVLILIFSYLRIIYEEKMMKEKFGIEGDDYAKDVKRFIPFLW